MKTAILFLALFVLGFFPVMLVLSVWRDDPEPTPEVLTPAEQAARDTQMQNFLLNREGCELARTQVERTLVRERGHTEIALERCAVASGDVAPEWVAQGQAKFLGEKRWDPPVNFAVWFVETGGGKVAPCAVHLEGRARIPMKKPHRSCRGWAGRSG